MFYRPPSAPRALAYTGVAVPVWQMAGLGAGLVVLGVLLLLGAKKSSRTFVRKLMYVLAVVAVVSAATIVFNWHNVGIVFAMIAIVFTMGLWASAGNLLPRFAFEPVMNRDGVYAWRLTRNGKPLAGKRRHR